jgi:hypothetical protein
MQVFKIKRNTFGKSVVRIVGLSLLTEVSNCTLGHILIVVRSEAIATVRKIRHWLSGRCQLGLSQLQNFPGAAA